MTELDMNQTFQMEIARELLMSNGVTMEETELTKLMELCKWNPWDAHIVHQLVQRAKES